MLNTKKLPAYDDACPLCRLVQQRPCVFHGALAWDALRRDVMAAGEEDVPLAERKPITETLQ